MNAKRFNVYVIEFDKAILKVQKFRDANRDYDPTKPCVYVEMTARSPEERFRQHLSGYKAARFTKRNGIRLRPRLYQRFNPLTFEEARYMETEFARRLRKRGYGVWHDRIQGRQVPRLLAHEAQVEGSRWFFKGNAKKYRTEIQLPIAETRGIDRRNDRTDDSSS